METSEAAQRAAGQAVEQMRMRRPLVPHEEEGIVRLLELAFEGYGQARDERIRELEGDQEILLDDVMRLNTCLARAHENRESAQRRLAGARAKVMQLRGLEPVAEPAPKERAEPETGDEA